MTTSSGNGRAVAMRAARDRLAVAGAQEPDADARLLFAAATDLSPLDVVTAPQADIAHAALSALDAMLARRIAGEPVARILGRKAFWGMSFALSPGTLEPRADSEIVVEAALAHLGNRRGDALRIADLGTGSGCLLAALLTELPASSGVGIDISADAAGTARANLAEHGLAARADVIVGGWDAAEGPFDLVVGNPPYIPVADIAGLSREVRDHDPRLALDGGADGLNAYRDIMRLMPALLARTGVAVFEIGFDQAGAVTRIAQTHGLRREALALDLQGHDRALVFTWS